MNHYEVLRDRWTVGHRRGSRDDEIRPRTGELPPADHSKHLAEALVKTYIGDALAADFYLVIADVLPAEVADCRALGAAETGIRSSSSPRSAKPLPRARGSATGWRCGHAGCSARPSPRPSRDGRHDELVDLWCRDRRVGSAVRVLRTPAAHHATRMQELGWPDAAQRVQFAIIRVVFRRRQRARRRR
jgi:hypothetical protein